MPRDRRRKLLYWITQIVAWSLLVIMLGLIEWANKTYKPGMGWILLVMLVLGIGFSHLLRSVIVRQGWLSRSLGFSLPRLALVSVPLGIVSAALQAVAHDTFFPKAIPLIGGRAGDLLQVLLNSVVLLFAWGLMYFSYHWFLRGRQEEVRNLRLETANREGQLANLRSQLNPHFMFNALNGIRALIDEDPVRAKQAITQLSAILRNAMGTVKRKTVPLGEEIDIVKAYLALEQMRFEERLQASFDVDPTLERVPVPPMLLQTLVENAIKHGIAKLTAGGEVRIGAHRGLDGLVLSVSNSGTYTPGQVNGTGIGIANTRKRLMMIYGPKALLRIENRDGLVVTEVELPANTIPA